MTRPTQQGIHHILQQDSGALNQLLNKLKINAELQAILHRFLPEKLASSCSVSHYEKGKLLLVTTSASWATQIRFSTPELIKKLNTQKEFRDLKAITCKIIPAVASAKPIKSKPMALLSKETARLIENAADTIKDVKLKNILLKIAARKR